MYSYLKLLTKAISKINKGYFYMLISSASFALMALQVKAISGEMPTIQIAFWRSLIVSISIIVLLKWRPSILDVFYIKKSGGPIVPLEIKEAFLAIFKRPILLIRGILGTIALLLYFEALSKIKFTEAVMLGYSYPIFISLLSIFILKEPFRLSVFLYIILSITGVVLISKPGFDHIELAKLYALVAAIFIAGAKVTIKKAGEQYAPWIIVFSFTFLSTLLSFPAVITHFVPFTPQVILFIFGISLATFIGQFFMTYALQFIEVAKGSVISLSTIVIAMTLSLVIFQNTPDIYSLVGGLFIFYAGVRITLSKDKKKVGHG